MSKANGLYLLAPSSLTAEAKQLEMLPNNTEESTDKPGCPAAVWRECFLNLRARLTCLAVPLLPTLALEILIARHARMCQDAQSS